MTTRLALIATIVFLAAVPAKNQSAPTALTVVGLITFLLDTPSASVMSAKGMVRWTRPERRVSVVQ